MKATSRVAAAAHQAKPAIPKTLMKSQLLSRSAMPSPTRSSLIACASLCAITSSAFAANQSWDGDTDANWATAANWIGNAVPGANTGTPADVATFDTPSPAFGGAASPVIIDAATVRRIGGIAFGANAGSYVIGDPTLNPLTLVNVGNGPGTHVISMAAGTTNPQVIAAPINYVAPSSTNGVFGYVNNSSTASATLSFTGSNTNAASRPAIVLLDGTNTGNNTISGNINFTLATQGTPYLIKQGAGKWILSGTNVFSGTPMTSSSSENGIQVLDGVLSLRNNQALGTSGTAGQLQVWVGNKSTTYTYNSTFTKTFTSALGGGTIELANGITLDNGLTLNLFNGGTITSTGTNAADSRVKVGTAAATSVTLSTAASGDVFTLGNAGNDLTGGAADSVINISGPGTIVQTNASDYAGSFSINQGTLKLGSATALGSATTAAVAFGAGSTGKLQLDGNSITVTSLNTNATVGTPAIENNNAAEATLTVNNTNPSTYAGSLQNGAAGGGLALTKSGAGTLNLSGASSYTGATTITTGTLNVTGSLGNTPVTGASGATLAGNGTIAGSVTAGSNVHIAPGDGGDANIGTLTTGSLSLGTDSQLDFGITNTSTLDKIAVTNSGGLSISGGQLNINGGTAPFTTNGVYNLIGYSGAITGNVSSLSINGLNKSVTKNYALGTSGGFVTLTVTNSGVVQNFWNTNANGNWNSLSNWSTGAFPNAAGAFAGFGGGGTEITADRTISVNGAFTVGTLAFNGAANGKSYTLAAGTGAHLTLNNGPSSGAFVTDTSGNHTIEAPITMPSNGTTFTVSNAADTLAVSSVIDGGGTPLIKGGAGTLALSGANTYLADTVVNGGTIVVSNPASLGDPTFTTTINGGTVRAVADVATTRSFQIGDLASTIAVAPGVTYTLDGFIADAANVGVLNKTDTGTLVLNGSNSYTGGTVINAGTVRINNPNSLGDAVSTLTLNDALLQATATFSGGRNITLGSANSSISVFDGMTYTVNGVVSGNTLNKVGPGTLTLNGTNTFAASILKAGTVKLGGANAGIGTGPVTFQGATLSSQGAGAGDPGGGGYGFANNFVVAGGDTGTLNLAYRGGLGGTLTGAGTFNVNVHGVRDDFAGNWSAFTGQINVGTMTGFGDFRINTTAGFGTARLNLATGVSMYVINNFGAGGATFNIGELAGAAGSSLGGGPTAGRVATFSVGAANTDATFAGVLKNSAGTTAITKVGSGTWTLSGLNTYTGNTTLSAGTLNLADNAGLTFVIGANGVANKVTGAGTATLNGDFTFDLTGAVIAAGNTWTIVDVTPQITFGSTFSVAGFEDNNADNIWTKVDGSNTWSFNEATGVLSVSSSSQYDSWATSKGLHGEPDANNGPDQDPDFDGIANSLEFALGGNPLAPDNSKLPVLTTDATNFIFTFSRADESEAEIALTFQWGSSLNGWTDVPIGTGSSSTAPVTVNVTENADALPDTIQVLVPKSSATGGKLFGRLSAVK